MNILNQGTNSPTGIGRAAAHQFARNGSKAVYLCDYDDSHLATHKREIESLYPGVDVHVRCFDAADNAAVKAVVDDAIRTYKRLDIFFANAGIVGQPVRFTDCDEDDFMGVLKTNVLRFVRFLHSFIHIHTLYLSLLSPGTDIFDFTDSIPNSPFLAIKYASEAMKLTSPSKPYTNGSIICTASVAGLRSNAGSTAYSASKAAVISLAQTTAYQLIGTGIRVNAICPGLIETGMTQVVFDMARARGTERKIGQLNPLQRAAVADEVARVALFLGSDESSYVNGQAWAVCGGLSAGHPWVPGKLA